MKNKTELKNVYYTNTCKIDVIKRFACKNITGITLVALIITIIVLLILAGIVINLALGNNGLLNRAKEADKEYKLAQIRETVEVEILSLDTEKISKGEKLTVEEALTQINENKTFEEIDLIEETGVIKGYTVTLGYDENGKVVIVDISKGTRARIMVKLSTEEYTNKNVELQIEVKPKETKITSIEIPTGIITNEQGKYEVVQNGTYLIKAVLENGEILEKEVKIGIIDKLPPKTFAIEVQSTENGFIINGETVDEEATSENASSGIGRYVYTA